MMIMMMMMIVMMMLMVMMTEAVPPGLVVVLVVVLAAAYLCLCVRLDNVSVCRCRFRCVSPRLDCEHPAAPNDRATISGRSSFS